MKNAKLVYIVDDSADYRFLVKAVFTRYLPVYQLRFFESGNALLHDVFRGLEQPDLILLDRHMPGRDGHSTLETLKKHPDWQVVPVVMVSSGATVEQIENCYRSGANSFLHKPTEFEHLRHLLQSIGQYWLDLNQRADPGLTSPAHG